METKRSADGGGSITVSRCCGVGSEEEEAASSEEVEIIEEEDVPLANKPVEEGNEKGFSVMTYVAGGTGLAAILALVIFFIVKKRKTA